jgi:hypothetical protein
MGKPRSKPNYRLDHCKSAVLNSLGSAASRRVYEYAIDQFMPGTAPNLDRLQNWLRIAAFLCHHDLEYGKRLASYIEPSEYFGCNINLGILH